MSTPCLIDQEWTLSVMANGRQLLEIRADAEPASVGKGRGECIARRREGEDGKSWADDPRRPALAELDLAGAALRALAAGLLRADRDAIADGDAADARRVEHQPGELMAHHLAGLGQERAAERVQVGPADPAGRDLEHELSVAGDRVGQVGEGQLARGVVARGEHLRRSV